MKSNIRHSAIAMMAGILLFLGGAGCAAIKRVVSKPPPPAFVHTVQWSGETLSVIAKWYTGKAGNWRTLADVNPHLNPNLIAIGANIAIPEDLLNTRQPMPREFLSRVAPKPKKAPQPSKKAPTPGGEEEEPTLFGPREEPTLFGPREYSNE